MTHEAFGRPFQRVVQVAGTDTLLAPANPRRRGIIFALADQASSVWVSLNVPGVVRQGLLLNPNNPQLTLWDHDWGRLVQAEFHGAAMIEGTPGGPQLPWTLLGPQQSGAAAGNVMTHTVASTQFGVLTDASVSAFVAGPPTLTLQIHRTGLDTVLLTTSAQANFVGPVQLQSGDQVVWRVNVAAVGSTIDLQMSGYDYDSAVGPAAGAPVAVWELEG